MWFNLLFSTNFQKSGLITYLTLYQKKVTLLYLLAKLQIPKHENVFGFSTFNVRFFKNPLWYHPLYIFNVLALNLKLCHTILCPFVLFVLL